MSAVTWSTSVGGMSVSSALPPHARTAPLARASSIIALHRSTVALSITDPSTTWPIGSPTGSADALAASRSTNSSAMASSTMIRSVDMQICPEFAKAPNAAPSTAASRSASSSTTSGAFPPSSSRLGTRCSAHVFAISRPTRVDPVKLTLRVARWAIIASTTSGASAAACVT